MRAGERKVVSEGWWDWVSEWTVLRWGGDRGYEGEGDLVTWKC